MKPGKAREQAIEEMRTLHHKREEGDKDLSPEALVRAWEIFAYVKQELQLYPTMANPGPKGEIELTYEHPKVKLIIDIWEKEGTATQTALVKTATETTLTDLKTAIEMFEAIKRTQ